MNAHAVFRGMVKEGLLSLALDGLERPKLALIC
jgi:hypothetical protein